MKRTQRCADRLRRRFASSVERTLRAGVLLFVGASVSWGANFYWNNGSGDGRWSNPANWTAGALPGADDTANFANQCPDAPQQITLDTNAWLSAITCTASGNRSFRITPQSGEFIRLNATYPLGGTSAEGVDLTIDAPILTGNGYLRVTRSGGATTLNASVGPLPEKVQAVI